MMVENEFLLGLVDNSSDISSARLAEKCRDLTLTWARYFYHGRIIEDKSIDKLLGIAASDGARYCLLLAYGQILLEQWRPEARKGDELRLGLEKQESVPVFLAGRILDDKSGWYGIDYRCLLVNLDLYSELGRPSVDESCSDNPVLPGVQPRFQDSKINKLEPRPGNTTARPSLSGWRLIAESLRGGFAVSSIENVLGELVLDLAPEDPHRAALLAKHLNGNINECQEEQSRPGLSEDQITFLDSVHAQTKNARRGVFLVNIEPYTDVDQPPNESWGPVSTLYSVAAGFKPNRILHTHGIDEETRVVFFDYSPNALEIRKTLLAEWDGDDFPDFVKYIFNLFPHPDTYYQLWEGQTPDDIDWSRLDKIWQQETERFGGARAFKNHWTQYRKLRHDFICSDILGSPAPLIERITPEPNAVMWFSNAPFTVYSNWHHDLDKRRQLYENFVSQVSARNPSMLLYGADYTNTSVNCISASEYWKRYRQSEHNELCPCPLNKHQIRS